MCVLLSKLFTQAPCISLFEPRLGLKPKPQNSTNNNRTATLLHQLITIMHVPCRTTGSSLLSLKHYNLSPHQDLVMHRIYLSLSMSSLHCSIAVARSKQPISLITLTPENKLSFLRLFTRLNQHVYRFSIQLVQILQGSYVI